MSDKYFDFIIHGGDYNPDQWIKTKEIWDEDIRLMKLSGVNSATVGIFSWSALEPEEGVYEFGWLDEIMDKLAANNINIILATPSGARPPWMAQKYPEVLRVNENGIRNEYGVRHNHCLTSPLYRAKTSQMNRLLAERYGSNPALKMWHVSNEYSGCCHCELCQNEFRKWLKQRYNNDLDMLNEKWWGGFWSHRYNDWEQISSPKDRGENHVSALKLCWNRFVTDMHISFFENEIAPLRELTPDIPITTNFMRMYSGIDYQRFAKHLDVVSWDNYPEWGTKDADYVAAETAFVHDAFRSMKGGKPFFMMESTPGIVNWRDINKLPVPGTLELSAVHAVACGSDSVQYFQWRKSRGGHEKFHGAVVDHNSNENTRVFREVAHLGEVLSKLGGITGSCVDAQVAVICDWEEIWATEYFCGYNNKHREYVKQCQMWYSHFYNKGIQADVISMDDDFSKYSLVVAPFLYMIKDGVDKKIERYVADGGNFVTTYLSCVTDIDDRCFLGGFPAGELKKVFGLTAEETDSLPDDRPGSMIYKGDNYKTVHMCDILTDVSAEVLGRYDSDFYAGTPAVTVNNYGKGRAYYVAFRDEGDFSREFCTDLISELGLAHVVAFEFPSGVSVRKRGSYLFLMNFSPSETTVSLDRSYYNVLTGETVDGDIALSLRGYAILSDKNIKGE